MDKNNDENFIYTLFLSEDTPTYSVRCENADGDLLCVLENLTDNRETAENFCRMLNSASVHPCHLDDIWEDYFY